MTTTSTMNPRKLGSGGKREGAGRKPTGRARRVTRSVNLDAETWQRIDAKAKNIGISASELVNRWGSKIKMTHSEK